MQYDFELKRLSKKFYEDRITNSWTEVLEKENRSYNCIVVDTYYDFFVCVPFRSDMSHKYGYHFRNSARSRRSHSAVDYSKIVLIEKHEEYFSQCPAVIDKDEFVEFTKNSQRIIFGALTYLEDYIRFKNEDPNNHSESDLRKFGFTSLKYFDDILRKHNLIN